MKNLLLVIFLVIYHISWAQSVNFISVELGGTGGLYSLNYHRDINAYAKNCYFSFRSGLSVIPIKFQESVKIYPSAIVEGGYTIVDHFEFGLGVNASIDSWDSWPSESKPSTQKTLEFLLLPRVGYRTIFKERFLFKAAFTPATIDTRNRFRTNKQYFSPWFGITLGYKMGK